MREFPSLAGNLALQRMLSLGMVQPSLTIGSPEDPLEREADQVARQVVQPKAKPCACGGTCDRCQSNAPLIQRRADQPTANGAGATADRTVLKPGAGHPLDAGTRSFFEPRMGHDFTKVRIHSGARAATLADAIHAQAYTAGTNIVFAQGQFAPNTSEGKQLLAHELTHVVQQAHGEAPTVQRQDSDDSASGKPPPLTKSQTTGIERIEEILKNTWVGPSDETEIEGIWAGFGSGIANVFRSHRGLWDRCIARGAELDDLPQVQDARTQFEADVKGLANNYLNGNMGHIMMELKAVGVTHTRLGTDLETGTDPASREEQSQHLLQLRNVARQIKEAQDAQKQLQELVVGYDLDPSARPGLISILTGGPSPQEHAEDLVARGQRDLLYPTTFSPFAAPHHPPFGDEEPPMVSQQETRKHYDRLAELIAALANQHPGAYALVRDGKVQQMAQADNPRQAQAIVGEALQETLDNIHTTIQALNSDDLDYLDLWPLHEQLYARDPWSQPFYRWVADQETEGHQRAEFWINVGLSSLAAIGFLIANLATFGTATFFIAAGVGVAAGGYQVGRNWERYFDLAAARGSSTSEETELVTGSQVNAELAASIIDSVMLFLAVASTAGRGFSARGGGPRTPGRPGGGGGTGGGGRNLMQLARKAVTRRVESFKQRLMNALRGHNWADEPLKSLEDAEAAIEKVFQQQSREAARIGSGTSRALAGEIGGELTEAQRQTLVAEYMRDLRAWREAALNRAHLNFAKHSLVKGSAGSGYGSRGLGHPPARRPPSGHHGGGWESGW